VIFAVYAFLDRIFSDASPLLIFRLGQIFA